MTINIPTVIPTVFLELLKSRGISEDAEISAFLYPKLSDLKRPELMKNLPEAAKTVANYFLSDKPIIVWGDYDVDGTTGTSLLVNFFKECGREVHWHIPNRITEGYGLNVAWFIENPLIQKADDFLLITVDCGISNHREVAAIKELGGTVIVTDHHSLPKDSIPQCIILNPSQEGCGFNGEHLAGVGVAFYLAAALRAALSSDNASGSIVKEINLKHYLAFVALGTIADVVEITTTNRILVRAGLEALSGSRFPGICELLASCDITTGETTSEDIGFMIGPKINAAGRLGNSSIVVSLFTENNNKRARMLARQLSELNERRRNISSDNFDTIVSYTSRDQANQDNCIVEVGDIHPGVAGIVASRIVELYGFPTIVFAEKEADDGVKYYVGSARSIEGVNILNVIAEQSGLIERFGGHAMAAGLTIRVENFKAFKQFVVERFQLIFEKRPRRQIKQFDMIFPAKNLMTREYLDFFQYLEPFGPGNLQPIFRDTEVVITDSRAVGKGKEHLQVTIRGKYSNLKGIGFSLGAKIKDIQETPKRAMTYAPTKNRYRGTVSWQVRVIDI